MDTATTLPKSDPDGFEDTRTICPMLCFEQPTGECQAFEYISLARAQLDSDWSKITLQFASAKVTISLISRTEKKADLSIRDLFRGIAGHTIVWIERGRVVEAINIEMREEDDDEFADMDPPGGG